MSPPCSACERARRLMPKPVRKVLEGVEKRIIERRKTAAKKAPTR